MSPIGGVGINLAVQDAVAAATILAAPLRRGQVTPSVLAKVRRRRGLPTVVTQGVQRLIQNALLRPALDGRTDVGGAGTPLPLRVLQRFPVLQGVPAYLVAIGLRPEHAPTFARRKPSKIEQ
jgi:2-polyprenyl-6-methoxyphenol hydroxylase-like FAD-dependent oxidoreductase